MRETLRLYFQLRVNNTHTYPLWTESSLHYQARAISRYLSVCKQLLQTGCGLPEERVNLSLQTREAHQNNKIKTNTGAGDDLFHDEPG